VNGRLILIPLFFTNGLDEFCRIVRNGAISSGTFKKHFERFVLSEGLHLRVFDREIKSSPSRKLCRLSACYFVSERNSVGRIRA
jgi:hypothetical protein